MMAKRKTIGREEVRNLEKAQVISLKKLKPDRTEKATVDNCSFCGKDLSDQKVPESINGRIIENIPDVI
jgi:hypothetical protein